MKQLRTGRTDRSQMRRTITSKPPAKRAWVLASAALNLTSGTLHVLAAPAVVGAKTLLLIRATTAAQPREPISSSEASNRLRQVDAFYAKQSGGRLRLNFTVTPPLRLSQPDFGLAAFEKAQSLGFDYRKFDIVVVAHASQERGGDAMGMGATRAGGYNDLFNTYVNADGLIHELGHVFGLPHAGLWRTTDGTPNGRGKGISIRFNPNDNKGGTKGGVDFRNHPFDGMNYGQGDFNSRFKNYLGWLPDTDVRTITESGMYRLAAHDMPSKSSTSPHPTREVQLANGDANRHRHSAQLAEATARNSKAERDQELEQVTKANKHMLRAWKALQASTTKRKQS